MIQGAINGRGGEALARHLTCTNENEVLEVLPARCVVADNMSKQLRELEARSSHGRTTKPIHHLHVDPATEWSEAQYARHLELYEQEFCLTNQPRLAVFHRKHGRGHRHYVYTLVRRDGSTIRMSNDYARREKVSRVLEHEFGEPLVGGRHNRAVAAALQREGRLDVVASMEAAGLLAAERPVAAISPAERQQQRRTCVEKLRIEEIVLAAWQNSADSHGFRTRLEAVGLSLAIGDKVPVAVDRTGNAHSLTRMIGKATKEATGVCVKAADVRARLQTLALRPLTDIRLETQLVPLMADLEDMIEVENGIGRDKPDVMHGNVDGADDVMVDGIAAILEAADHNDYDLLPAAVDPATVDAVVEILADSNTITATVEPADADIDAAVELLVDIDRLSVNELDGTPSIDSRSMNLRHAGSVDNAVGGASGHAADNTANDNTVEEVTAMLDVMGHDEPNLLPVSSADANINAVAELIADSETIDRDTFDVATRMVTELADLVTDIHKPPTGQGLGATDDAPTIGSKNGIDRPLTQASEQNQHKEEKTNDRRISPTQRPCVFDPSGPRDAGSSYTRLVTINAGSGGGIQGSPSENTTHLDSDRQDCCTPPRRTEHSKQKRGENAPGASGAARPKSGTHHQPARGGPSAAGTARPGSPGTRPAKPVTTGARQGPTVVRPPSRTSLWRQAVTRIGGRLNRLVTMVGLKPAPTRPPIIQDSTKSNVGQPYKHDAKAQETNLITVERIKADQVAKNASPLTRLTAQAASRSGPVDRVPPLAEVQQVSGHRGATMLAPPPEPPKRLVDVMLKFTPTIMPTAPCQKQRNEMEPQQDDETQLNSGLSRY